MRDTVTEKLVVTEPGSSIGTLMSTSKPTVLLVDPYALMLEAISKLLGPRWRCRKATDVVEARKQLDDEVGIVVVEYRLQGKNGLHFLEEVRQAYPHTVNILLVSSFFELERPDIQQAQQSGLVWSVLEKPFDKSPLLRLFSQAHQHHNSAQCQTSAG